LYPTGLFRKGMQMLEILKKERFLRLKDVMARTGLSRSTIYLGISKGNFPQNINLGPRCVGWLESEIDGWIQARINQRSIIPQSAD
jgi:prophage regulatory protein